MTTIEAIHPGHRDEVSRDIALEVSGKAASLRRRIYDEFKAVDGAVALTADDIAVRLNIEDDYIDVRKRVSELYQYCYLRRVGSGLSLIGRKQRAYVIEKSDPHQGQAPL